ncbi:uncharacterized protein VP01_7893g1 [Puccinia sorghi]|uniref:Uncharacterized protein n=1 Tax=Puccinia sorghi TaxID=27349 RepID=A0A0L6UCZ9_9BASI|nr:uncharacterized protein VP01_7893g1 [Puccinia sorghi]
MLHLDITQAAFEACDFEDFVLGFAAIKKQQFLAEHEFFISQNLFESLLIFNIKSSRLPQQLQNTPACSFGNGFAIGMFAHFCRISEGTVILHCSHVVHATMAHESIAETTGFKKFVGFIDGILIPLDKKPSINSQDYYLRKGSYGIATL